MDKQKLNDHPFIKLLEEKDREREAERKTCPDPIYPIYPGPPEYPHPYPRCPGDWTIGPGTYPPGYEPKIGDVPPYDQWTTGDPPGGWHPSTCGTLDGEDGNDETMIQNIANDDMIRGYQEPLMNAHPTPCPCPTCSDDREWINEQLVRLEDRPDLQADKINRNLS